MKRRYLRIPCPINHYHAIILKLPIWHHLPQRLNNFPDSCGRELHLLLRAKEHSVTQPAKQRVIEAVPDQKHCLGKKTGQWNKPQGSSKQSIKASSAELARWATSRNCLSTPSLPHHHCRMPLFGATGSEASDFHCLWNTPTSSEERQS